MSKQEFASRKAYDRKMERMRLREYSKAQQRGRTSICKRCGREFVTKNTNGTLMINARRLVDDGICSTACRERARQEDTQ